jgi:hypothetical protein
LVLFVGSAAVISSFADFIPTLSGFIPEMAETVPEKAFRVSGAKGFISAILGFPYKNYDLPAWAFHSFHPVNPGFIRPKLDSGFRFI